jgi:putative inorganic carbon (HCO3(-)) transporter
MNFVLFLLLNAVLLLRPEELFPEITGLRLYLMTIVPCTLLSLPRLSQLLSSDSLRRRPVAVCVLLFFASTIVSLLVQGRIEDALFDFGPEFAKVILYYFLLLAVVDTPERFRIFVAALVVLISGLTAVALAQQYGLTDFPNITPAMQREFDPVTGEECWIPRMVSSGIFNDPNDLCLLLGLGILSCVYCVTKISHGFVGGLVWFLPVPLFIYAVLETHSRGGLLGVLGGAAGYLYSRFGGAKALPFALVGVAVSLAVVGGRQGNIGGGGGTSHERVMMWADGLTNLFQKPLFVPTGLGEGWFVDENGLVAHNSFVQAYVEFGLFGGGAFLGAFLLGLRILDRLGRGVDAPKWAIDSRHFAFAALVGYAAGCYSLTRNFVIPTYLTLGLASVILDQAAPNLPEKFQVTREWFGRAVLFAICGLVFMKCATQALGMAGI